MSSQPPITPARFALALESLPLDALHAKASELRNSISQLKSSNEQMLPFAENGDADCREAMFENLGTIGRFGERIGLIRGEVERRGLPWGCSGGEQGNGEGGVNGVVDGAVNGPEESNRRAGGDGDGGRGGSLTDEELRRRVEEQMGGEEENGVYL